MKDHPELYKYEKELLESGIKLIAGCDEAGRGPLAGRVYAASVILNPEDKIVGLYDSKKLTEKERDYLFDEIKKRSLSYAITYLEAEDIDEINILEASRKCMEMAISRLSIKPEHIITDYMDLYKTNIPYTKLAHGDMLSATVAAASILAKVERDRYMDEMDKLYPEYGFSLNKGYPTKKHLEALEKYGITPIHRKSYGPVKKMLQLKLDI